MAFGQQTGIPYSIIGGLQEDVSTYRTNYGPNPSFETGQSGWAVGTLKTIAPSTDVAVPYDPGVQSLKVTGTGAGDTNHGFYGVTSTIMASLVLPDVYTFALWVYASSWSSGTVRLSIEGVTGLATTQGSTVTPTNSWQRIIVAATIPTTAVTGNIVVRSSGAGTSTNILYLDGFTFTRGASIPPTFNGDTPGYKWLGTPHASSSQQLGTRAVFNDQTDADFTGQLPGDDAISGLDGTEVIEVADNLTEADGGVHGNFYRGRRPFTFHGQIVPIADPADRNRKTSRISSSTAALRQRNPNDPTNGDCVVQWYPDGAPEPMFIKGRMQQPFRATGTWIKDFYVGLVAADPRMYGIKQRAQTILAAPNLIRNPSFETDTSTWTLSGAATLAARQTGWASDGSASLRTTHSPGAGVVQSHQAAGTGPSNVFPVNGGTTWTLKADTNVLSVTGTASAYVQINWLDAGGGNAGVTAGNAITTTGAHTTSVTVTSPATAVNANVYLVVYGGASGGTIDLYWDAVQFVNSTLPLTYYSGVPGRSYDRSYDINYDWGTQVNRALVTNAGDGIAPVVARIYGPGINPALQNVTTGEEISLQGTLATGESYEVDTLAKTVTFISAAGVRSNSPQSIYVPRSLWWGLLPGSNDIRLVYWAGYTAGTSKAVINYRYTWI